MMGAADWRVLCKTGKKYFEKMQQMFLGDSSSSRLGKQRSHSAFSRKPEPQPKAGPEMNI